MRETRISVWRLMTEKAVDADAQRRSTFVNVAKINEERMALEETLEDKDHLLQAKNSLVTKFLKEKDEAEAEIPELKQKLAEAESVAKEKTAVVNSIKKEHEAEIKVLEAQLAEAKIARAPSTNGSSSNAEVSTHSGEAEDPREDCPGVFAIVGHPIL